MKVNSSDDDGHGSLSALAGANSSCSQGASAWYILKIRTVAALKYVVSRQFYIPKCKLIVRNLNSSY